MGKIKKLKETSRKIKKQKHYPALIFSGEECYYLFKLGIVLGTVLGVGVTVAIILVIKIVLVNTTI